MTRSISEIVAGLEMKLLGTTPGPWEQGDGEARGRADYVYSDDATGSAVASTSFSYVPRLVAEVNANAAFIAACDPGTIRALIDALKAAQGEKAARSKRDDETRAWFDLLDKEDKRLRADLAAMTKERDEARGEASLNVIALRSQLAGERKGVDAGLAMRKENDAVPARMRGLPAQTDPALDHLRADLAAVTADVALLTRQRDAYAAESNQHLDRGREAETRLAEVTRERDEARQKREPNPEWEAKADAHHAAATLENGIEPEATLVMLKRWKADAEPANELGQTTFSRAMLDSATDALEAVISQRDAAHSDLTEAGEVLASIDKVRLGYVDQAKFADHEPAAYFREFVRRIDAALSHIRNKEGV